MDTSSMNQSKDIKSTAELIHSKDPLGLETHEEIESYSTAKG